MITKLPFWTTAACATVCLAATHAAADRPLQLDQLTAKAALHDTGLGTALLDRPRPGHHTPVTDLPRVNPAPMLPGLNPDSGAPLRFAQYGDYEAREKAKKKAAKKAKKESKKEAKERKKKKPGKIKQPTRKSASKARKPANFKSADKARRPAYKKSESKIRTERPARSKYTGPAKDSKVKNYKSNTRSGRKAP